MEKATLEMVIALVDQLSSGEQAKLIEHLQEQGRAYPIGDDKRHSLTVAERMTLFRRIQIDSEVVEEPSPRREDWYGDDGR